MRKNSKKKLHRFFQSVIASAIVVVSVGSICLRVPQFVMGDNWDFKNSFTNLSITCASKEDGSVNSIKKNSEVSSNKNNSEKLSVDENTYTKNDDKKQEVTKPTEKVDNSGKKKYPVYESQLGTAGEITIKNTTDYTVDVEKELAKPLGFKMEDTIEPQVLIVHTHTSEAYLKEDVGFYYEDYSGRSTDESENVTSVGDAIVKKLNSRGIGALHSLKHHDSPTYNGSYNRSEVTTYSYLKKYPSIKVVIDIHRDAIGNGGEEGKYKPTFVANGKKGAQIMIMSGYDPTGAYGFSHWEKNLSFALKLEQTAEKLYPGMTRPLYFGDFAYNMFINSGSLLIEVGTDVNTVEEATYTGELLGDVLAQVLQQ